MTDSLLFKFAKSYSPVFTYVYVSFGIPSPGYVFQVVSF
ncbi:hypothetical protein LEP1GSC068_0847 [Leptospira sp. Fiocruz LV3954]|nr:hypothetical protein LEP1GSC068_0847 [Leptospira sp. Fiocruz LV3954]EMI68462.1 hypothetical protein LEP1GSC076_1763 [Leptospira sp. Fiocruz LV4135]